MSRQHRIGRDSWSGLDRHPVPLYLSFPCSEMGDEPWMPRPGSRREVRVGCTEEGQLLGATPPGAPLQGCRYCSSLVQSGSQGFTSSNNPADRRQTPDKWLRQAGGLRHCVHWGLKPEEWPLPGSQAAQKSLPLQWAQLVPTQHCHHHPHGSFDHSTHDCFISALPSTLWAVVSPHMSGRRAGGRT